MARTIADLIKAIAGDLANGIDSTIIEKRVRGYLDNCSVQRAELLRMFYGIDIESVTTSKIAESLGMSKEDVTHVRLDAIKDLRRLLLEFIGDLQLFLNPEVASDEIRRLRRDLRDARSDLERLKKQILAALGINPALVQKLRSSEPVSGTGVAELELATDTVRALEEAGVFSIEQLLNKTEAELEDIPGLGKRRIHEIKGELTDRGLQLWVA